MNDAGVPFIVVGGVAVVAHGYGRLTHDLDLVVRLQPDHVRNAFRAFASLGYAPRVPITGEQFADEVERERLIEEKGMAVLNFWSDQHRDTPVDIFVREPFDFDDELRVALKEEIAAGVLMPIVSLKTLLRLKADTGRPQDIADAAELRSLRGGSI